ESLHRELQEELSISPVDCHPLCVVEHDYGRKVVRLHFFVVESFKGEPRSMEGQAFAWRAIEELPRIEFPEANKPVAQALNRWLSRRCS
ncbi:MAG: hypothetical protein ACPGSC_13350, partial [Granulosicoccaceae bacterium]